MSLGMQWAGFDSVAAVEVDKDAAATYRRNFPSANVWNGRIGDIQDSDVPSLVGTRAIDVLLGGCPCQGFSIAGRRDPEDPRNALFWETIRFARLLRPQFVVLENVPGIITMQGGQVLELIRSEFSAIGYPDMTVLILEAADYGVPQYRPRAIFVANRLGVKNPYPNAVVTPEDHRSIESAIEDLAVVQRDLATNHDWTHHSPQMVERLSKVEPGGSLYDSYTDAWKRQYTGVPSMTIKENHGGSHIHYHLDRTLSAREMARLQSFPDSFFFEGRMKRAMFQIGNAVPPVLAKHIGLAVRTRLRQPEDQEVV
jgi:DNA (cytosine-5)-methyltransferase 1